MDEGLIDDDFEIFYTKTPASSNFYSNVIRIC
jgi:hypothetical protein